MANAPNHFCIFAIGDSTFAASATQIREIVSKPDYSRFPCNSANLAGLWHEGTEFLPIIRLPFQHDLQPDRETQVLVIDGMQGHWGLLVDQVLTVAEIEYTVGNETGETERSSAVMGMATWSDRSVRVLQLDAVYRLTEQTVKRDCDLQFSPQNESETLSLLGSGA